MVCPMCRPGRGRAGHWLTQSLAMIQSSKAVGILDYSSILSLLSLSSGNARSGFPYHNMACYLGVRTVQNTGEFTGQVNQ